MAVSTSHSNSPPLTTQSTAHSVSSRLSLYLHPRPAIFPIVDQWFDITIFCVDENNSLQNDVTAKLTYTVHYQNGDQVINDRSIFTVEPKDRIAGFKLNSNSSRSASGGCVLRCRFSKTSHSSKHQYFLRIEASECKINSHDAPQITTSIEPVSTPLFTVVKHALRITAQPPPRWYKDEGGRDNCMVLSCDLIDHLQHTVTTRNVPLSVKLCYASDIPTSDTGEEDDHSAVKNQSILKFSTESMSPAIDSTGTVTIRLRIEQVSKNHQGQSFILRISPDVSADQSLGDIAPISTNPVQVLSKRNKKRRITSDDHTPHGNQLIDISNTEISSNTHIPLSIATIDPPNSVTRSQISVSQSVGSIGEWADYVNSGLEAMEWQHIGFEINERGDIHLQRPLYRCPSCWTYKDAIQPAGHHSKCMIHCAIHRYKSEVTPALQRILQTLSESQSRVSSDNSHHSVNNLKKDKEILSVEFSNNHIIIDDNLTLPRVSKDDQPIITRNTSEQVNAANPFSDSLLPPQLISQSSYEFTFIPPQIGDQLPFPYEESLTTATIESIMVENSVPYGFPCFDASNSLVGFVKEENGQFYPLAQLHQQYTSDDSMQIDNLAENFQVNIPELSQYWNYRFNTSLQSDNGSNELLWKRDYMTFSALSEKAVLLNYSRMKTNNQEVFN